MIRNNKLHLYIIPIIFVVISVILITVGYSSWVITDDNTISTEEVYRNEINNSVISNEFDFSVLSTETTYNGSAQAPHSYTEYIENVYEEDDYYNLTDTSLYKITYTPYTFNSSTMPINAGSYTVRYHNLNSNLVSYVDYTIKKATPTLTIPSLPKMYYSKNINISTSNFTAKLGDTNISGNWTFEEGVLSNNGADENGNAALKDSHSITYKVTFTPTDTTNFEIVTTNLTVDLYSVCYIGSGGGKYYCDVKTALEDAANGTSKNVYIITSLLENGTSGSLHPIAIEDDIYIKSGVTLIIPHTNELWKIASTDELANIGNSFCDTNATNVSTYRRCLLQLSQGADIYVESGGTLNLGGEFKAGGISRYYSEINLDEGSSINIYGTFNAYGYIKEYSSTAKNAYQTNYLNVFDNSYDEGRLMIIYPNATVTTAFSAYSMPGGASLTTLISNNICLVNIFDFPNLQTFVEVKTGAILNAHTYMEVASYALDKDVSVVGGSKSSAIFKLSSGSLYIQYCPSNVQYTSSSTSFTNIYLNGVLNQGYLYIEVPMYTITSETSFLPLSYKIRVKVASGSTYTSNYKLKFMPGAQLFIEENASLILNNSVIFYKNDALTSTDITYPANKGDAKLVNNGQIVINSGGAIGGFIETTCSNGSASLDFTNAGSSSLSVGSPEGIASPTDIVVVSEGYFLDEVSSQKEICQFVVGSIVTSSIETIGCWDGERYAIDVLNISIDTSNNYAINILNYQVYVSDDANGTNEQEYTSGSTETSSSFNIPYGKYFRIVTSRCKDSYFVDSSYTFTSGTRYKMAGDITLIIVPHEGVKITYSSTSISGAGNTTYTFSECATQSGSFYSLGTKDANSSFTVIKGYFFKISASFGTGTSGKLSAESITVTPQINNSDTISLNTAYMASSNYTIKFNLKAGGFPCVTEDTLITLANGDQVRIDQLTGKEMILVLNHSTGKLEARPIAFLVSHDEVSKSQLVTELFFSNGASIKVLGDHGFFNATTNKYININSDVASNYIGDKFLFNNNGIFTEETLINVKVYLDNVRAFSIASYETITCFTNGILSSTPYFDPYLNAFDIIKDTYMYENMEEDIEKYGLFTYEDVKDYMTYEEFTTYNLKYVKISIGKGYITWEEFLETIEIFRSIEDDIV